MKIITGKGSASCISMVLYSCSGQPMRRLLRRLTQGSGNMALEEFA